MSKDLINEFKERIEEMLKLDRHNNHKGDELKRWTKENFNLNLAVGMIIQEKQRRNRILEQQRHNPNILIFVCGNDVNREKVIEEVKKLLYSNLVNICIISYDPNVNKKRDIRYESLYIIKETKFSLFAKDFFEHSIDLEMEIKDNNKAYENNNLPENKNIIDVEDCIKLNIFNIKREKLKDSKLPLNLIVYGAPGTSKTYNMPNYAVAIIENKEIKDVEADREKLIEKYQNYVKSGRIVFTTFHQNYGYEDFIQGLRPDTGSDYLSFKPVDGTFKKIADKAMIDGNTPYVIIIDEINRGNISKIFGELITLIEEDKRWGEENQMSVKLLSGEDFAVPNNLYIIGTMNSADKSISLIDAALRRRFRFEEMMPNSEVINDKKMQSIFNKLNENLRDQLESTDLLIGHSYFINKEEKDLVNILNRNIIPLLYEYFYDNRKKVESILNSVLKDTNIEICNNQFGRISVKEKKSQ